VTYDRQFQLVGHGEDLTKKSCKISSSANSSSLLGATRAALNITLEILPNFSTSPRTFSYSLVLVMSTLHVFTSTVFPVAFRESRIVWRSSRIRLLSRAIKATRSNLRAAKRDAVATPIPGPLPMRTRVCELLVDMVLLRI